MMKAANLASQAQAEANKALAEAEEPVQEAANWNVHVTIIPNQPTTGFATSVWWLPERSTQS